MNTLDLRALEIFRAVAIEGTVSQAAARLNRVQSNISTRIKQLEEQLGATLFQRHSRGLELTTEGRRLLSYAERLLQLSTEAAEAMADGTPTGGFTIGTMESTAATRLPAILSDFHRHHPAVDVRLVTDTAGGVLKRLRDREINVAFAAEPVVFDDLKTVPVFEESLVLVTPGSYPTSKEPAALNGRTVIAFDQGCAYRRYLEDWLLAADVVPGGVISVGSYVAILACVAAGTGFAVVPRAVLDTVNTLGDLQLHALPGPLARVRTLLVWRDDYRSNKLDALQALLPRL